MFRAILTVVLTAMLVLSAGTGALAAPDAGAALTLSGRLEYVTSPSVPHYELQGHVVLYANEAMLKAMAGQNVVAIGALVKDPTIYMRPTVEVKSIYLKNGSGDVTIPIMPGPAPADPAGPAIPAHPGPSPLNPPALKEPPPAPPTLPGAPPPAIPDDGVIIPAAPGPSLRPTLPGDHIITIPVMPDPAAAVPALPAEGADKKPQPVPLFGTSNYVLFGRLELEGGAPVLIQSLPSGDVRVRLSAAGPNIAALAGSQVALVVSAEGDSFVYKALDGINLSVDLGTYIKDGPGMIFATATPSITVLLRGQPVHFDQQPVFGNGRTLIGLRHVAEALGARVDWDNSSHTANVTLGNRTVVVTQGSNRVIVRQAGQSDTVIYADMAPIIAGGRTLVPVRVLAESLGLKVGWDPATRTVTLD